MSDEKRPNLGDDDERTPTERPPRQPASDAALRFARAATLLNSLASELAKAGGLLDRLPEHRRLLFLRDTVANGRATARALDAVMDDVENGSFG